MKNKRSKLILSSMKLYCSGYLKSNCKSMEGGNWVRPSFSSQRLSDDRRFQWMLLGKEAKDIQRNEIIYRIRRA